MAVFICQGCGTEHASWGGKCPDCGTTETIKLAQGTDRMVDRVVKNKYKIVRKLGQGGMGAVYLAEQLGIGHKVALKFLRAEFSNDAEIARRFLNEAKSYALVAHPNAVGLHELGQDDEGNLFIAMEYCEGVDLKKLVAEQGHLPVLEAIEIVLQVADVLANAHQKGVIHRDLKPENIMIRRGIRGVHAKVLDFGIARLMDGGTKLTIAGSIAGTPRYMSPEQVEGKEVDLRADIYSLGIVLYELLTGRQPFDGNTITDILRKQVVQPFPTLVSAAPELDDPRLEAVLQRACAKQAPERWADMVEFANALSQAIPTQANLSPLPLHRSSVPLPSAGVAVPGGAIEASSTERTLMKGAGAASTESVGQLVSTQVEGPAGPTRLTKGTIAPQVSKSKTPFVVLGVMVVGALVFATYVSTRPETPVSPTIDLPRPRTQQALDPNPNTEAMKALEAQQSRSREENARMSLGKGKTEFEVAKLDEAEVYLDSVAPGTESETEARALLTKIASIREKLKAASLWRGRGQCEKALPLYKAVLEINGKVKDALDGMADCRHSMVNTTME